MYGLSYDLILLLFWHVHVQGKRVSMVLSLRNRDLLVKRARLCFIYASIWGFVGSWDAYYIPSAELLLSHCGWAMFRERLFDSIFRKVVAKPEEADFTNDCSIFDAVLDLRDGQVP